MTPHTGGCLSGMKLSEEGSASNIGCSAIFAVLQPPLVISRQTGSGVDLQQTLTDLQLRDLTVRRKTNKQRNGININKKDIHTKTSFFGHQHQRPKVDKTTKMGKNRAEKLKIPKIRAPLLLQRITAPCQQQNKAG